MSLESRIVRKVLWTSPAGEGASLSWALSDRFREVIESLCGSLLRLGFDRVQIDANQPKTLVMNLGIPDSLDYEVETGQGYLRIKLIEKSGENDGPAAH